jgi:hypothetical protein
VLAVSGGDRLFPFLEASDIAANLTVNPLKHAVHISNICMFSPYLKENTTLHHYKDQLVNVV